MFVQQLTDPITDLFTLPLDNFVCHGLSRIATEIFHTLLLNLGLD